MSDFLIDVTGVVIPPLANDVSMDTFAVNRTLVPVVPALETLDQNAAAGIAVVSHAPDASDVIQPTPSLAAGAAGRLVEGPA